MEHPHLIQGSNCFQDLIDIDENFFIRERLFLFLSFLKVIVQVLAILFLLHP